MYPKRFFLFLGMLLAVAPFAVNGASISPKKSTVVKPEEKAVLPKTAVRGQDVHPCYMGSKPRLYCNTAQCRGGSFIVEANGHTRSTGAHCAMNSSGRCTLYSDTPREYRPVACISCTCRKARVVNVNNTPPEIHCDLTGCSGLGGGF